MKFDKDGKLSAQKIKYKIKHDELDEKIIDKYIDDNCNFHIDFDKEGNCNFKDKVKEK